MIIKYCNFFVSGLQSPELFFCNHAWAKIAIISRVAIGVKILGPRESRGLRMQCIFESTLSAPYHLGHCISRGLGIGCLNWTLVHILIQYVTSSDPCFQGPFSFIVTSLIMHFFESGLSTTWSSKGIHVQSQSGQLFDQTLPSLHLYQSGMLLGWVPFWCT